MLEPGVPLSRSMSRAISLRGPAGTAAAPSGRARRDSAPCNADQRSLDVAGELQLLHGDHHRLLDFRQQALVTCAGQFLVHGFERHRLALRLGKFRASSTATLACSEAPEPPCPAAPGCALPGRSSIALAEAPREFLLQIPETWMRVSIHCATTMTSATADHAQRGTAPWRCRQPRSPAVLVRARRAGADTAACSVCIGVSMGCEVLHESGHQAVIAGTGWESPASGRGSAPVRRCAGAARRPAFSSARPGRGGPTISKKLRRPSLLVSVTASSRPSSHSLSRGAGSSCGRARR
jgi:hypothetical protein